MKKSLCLFLVLCLAWIPASGQAGSGQTLKNNVLTDHDYRFQIKGPARAQVLNSEMAQSILPDAAAGLILDSGVYCFLVVEPAPTGTAESWSDHIIGQMSLGNQQLESRETLKFAGKEAVKTLVLGEAEGVQLRFQHIIFKNSNHLYQLVCWDLAKDENKGGKSFQSAVSAFQLLEGKVVGRKSTLITPDSAGIGWDYKNRTYRNAPLGLVVRPRAPWRVVIGDELDSMEASADVGLSHETAYVVITGERAAGASQEEFISRLQSEVILRRGLTSKPERVSYKVGGRDVSFIVYRASSLDRTFYHGMFFHGDSCIQVMAWYLTALEKKAKPTLAAAFNSIVLLNEDDRAKLTTELRAKPAFENSVGSEFTLLGGNFRRFDIGLQWKRPAGFWKFRLSQGSNKSGTESVLELKEPAAGLFGVCLVDHELGGLSGAGYHASLIDKYEGEKKEPVKIKLAGHEGFESTFVLKKQQDFTLSVFSTTANGKGLSIRFWGYPGNMSTAREVISSLLANLRFTGKPAAKTEKKGTVYTDHRLQFKLTLPSEKTVVEDATPEPVKPTGTIIACALSEETTLTLVAMCEPDDSDEDWFDAFSSGAFDFLDKDPETGKGELAGQPCSWVHYDGELQDARVSTFSRNQIHYCLMLTSSDPEDIKKQIERFSLLQP